MKNIMWLVTNMLRNMLLRNKRTLVLVIGLPIAGVLMSVLIYGNAGGTSVNIGVVNHDSTDITKDTVQFLKGLHKTNVKCLRTKKWIMTLRQRKLMRLLPLKKGFLTASKRTNQIILQSLQ